MKGLSRWKQHQQDQNATHSTRTHGTPPKRHAPQTTSGITPPRAAPCARSSTSSPRSRPAAGGAAAPAPAAPAAVSCPCPPKANLRARGSGVRYALAGGAARGDRPIRRESSLGCPLSRSSRFTMKSAAGCGARADPISGAPRTRSTPSPHRSARAAGTAQPARAALEGQGGVTARAEGEVRGRRGGRSAPLRAGRPAWGPPRCRA